MKGIDNMLIEIRKAYRLLHVFNSRIFDLMKKLDEDFNVKFGGGRSLFTNPTPREGKGKFESWIWDYFNLYFYEFYFKSNNAWLSVILESDTGLWDKIENYYDWDELKQKQDKIDLFNSLEESKTRLIFLTGDGNWSVKKIERIFYNNEYKNMRNEFTVKEKKGQILCKLFEINNFIDEETTNQTLTEYIKFLNDNDFHNIVYKKGK
jgi:hypothetical protein